MKFRKKPIVIEAEQWFPGKEIDGVINGIIETLEGCMKVSSGDWIIIGVEGERYCCKNSIFKKSYDPVDGEWPSETIKE